MKPPTRFFYHAHRSVLIELCRHGEVYWTGKAAWRGFGVAETTAASKAAALADLKRKIDDWESRRA